MGMKIPLHQSLGHSLHLHILSHSFHRKVTPSSPEDFHSSIGVSSIPGALSLGSAPSAVCTSSRVISGSLSHVHGILSIDGFLVPGKAGGSAPPISS